MISKIVFPITALQHRICLCMFQCVSALCYWGWISKDAERHQVSFRSHYACTATGTCSWTSGSLSTFNATCATVAFPVSTSLASFLHTIPPPGIMAGLWPIAGGPFIPLRANCPSISVAMRLPQGYCWVTTDLLDRVVGAIWSMAQDQGILKPAAKHPLPAPYGRQQVGCHRPVLPWLSWGDVGPTAALPATPSQAENHVIIGQTLPGFGSYSSDITPVLSRTGSIAHSPVGLGVGPCLLPEGVLQPSPGVVPIPLLPPYPFIGGCLSQTIMARCVLPFLAFCLLPPKLTGLQQAACTVALRAGVAGRAEPSPAQLSGCWQRVHGQKVCPTLPGGFHAALSCPAPRAISAPIHPQVTVPRESVTGLRVKQPFIPLHPNSTAFSSPPFSISALLFSPSSLQDALPLLSPPKWLWGRLEEPTGRGKEPASSSRCCPSVPLLGAARRTAGTFSRTKQPKILSTESVILCLRVNARRVKGREYLSPLCTA